MNTKRATLKDVKSIAPLFDQYRIFYKNPSNLSDAEAFLTERLRKNESVIFLAEIENKVVGFVQLYPLFSSTRMKRMWLLNDLFVDANFRGMGASKKLLECAKNLCKESNACELMLETEKNNHLANQLYHKTGWSLDFEHNFYTWNE